LNLSSSIRTRLLFQYQSIEELITGYDEESLKKHLIPGKWSAFENIVHLVSYQLIFQNRVDRILLGDSPSFNRYVAEDDPEFDVYLRQPLSQLLRTLHTDRMQIYHQLDKLTFEQLAYIGHHQKYGDLTLVKWIEFFLLHEAHHVFTLFKLLNEGDEEFGN
jgi:DinB superfamily